jgi:iron complex outermembrane receptor protein
MTHSAYIDNILPGGLGVGDADHGGLRGQLRLLVSDAVELITRADWSRSSEHFESSDHLLNRYAPAPQASSLVGDYTRVALNTRQINRETIWGVAEEINTKLNAALTLKSITAYRSSAYDLDVDVDGTERSVIIGTQSDQSKQLSQELDLVVNLPKFDGVAGLYYFTEHEFSSLTSALPTPGPNFRNAVYPDAHARSEAAFAQGTYHPLEAVGIAAGVRYTTERKDLDQFYDRTSLVSGAPLPVYRRYQPRFPRTHAKVWH